MRDFRLLSFFSRITSSSRCTSSSSSSIHNQLSPSSFSSPCSSSTRSFCSSTLSPTTSSSSSPADTAPVALSSSSLRSLLTSTVQSLTLPSLTPFQLQTFQQSGYLIFPSILSPLVCAAINHRVDLCFDGKFETGNYPDEWYWRKEMSKENITRHMCNIWKSDRGIASILLHEEIGKLAWQCLRSIDPNTSGMRLGNDSVWVKPPSASQSHVSYHRDSMYIPMAPSLTVWLTLTDVSEQNGTLEYIPGSHKWKTVKPIDRNAFHSATTGYRSPALEAAASCGIDESSVCYDYITAPAGSIVIHDGDMWHGSDANRNSSIWRRSIGVHMIREESKHVKGGGYIYSRYATYGSEEMDQAFFPVVYNKDGKRSAFLKEYLDLTDYPANEGMN